jgi:hypothetical protein
MLECSSQAHPSAYSSILLQLAQCLLLTALRTLHCCLLHPALELISRDVFHAIDALDAVAHVDCHGATACCAAAFGCAATFTATATSARRTAITRHRAIKVGSNAKLAVSATLERHDRFRASFAHKARAFGEREQRWLTNNAATGEWLDAVLGKSSRPLAKPSTNWPIPLLPLA